MLRDDDVGGGKVMRRIDRGGLPGMVAGYIFSRDEYLAMGLPNRHHMQQSGQITVWPIHEAIHEPEVASSECHIVHNGFGRFDVVVGHKLNDKPLSKDEAEELATRPE